MVQFYIQPDSEIPASNQLFNQIRFAIASRQFPPGHRLPSTRQLAMQTGLHRNTISKVYRQLEDHGLVEAQAGSGIYVKALGHEGPSRASSPILQYYPQANQIIQQSLDNLLSQGCSLNEARELFLAEIDWRLRCSARVLVTAPTQDIGIGQLMAQELEVALKIPVQLVPIEKLAETIEQVPSGTVVTSRYFIGEAEAVAGPRSVRVIPVDIYDFAKEIALVQQLPKGTYLGIVSLSSGLLRATEVIIHSLRGDDVLVMTAQLPDDYKINAIVRGAKVVICDQASVKSVKDAILANREEIIRPPQLVCCENYIGSKSINLLKRELGLN
ncbi:MULTISPECIES: GntR family transcriptional regulator [Arthrospira]|jgi:GntR family transcriptional regulator|uniref:GntR family transcriptional regulator n=1 Tax=Limnospira platensis NIES-46 TaxID=1236695 RepID=A0A5M3T392_LIMPL|nr:GntR family transcriptional regulator [Arthrospira platensis]AMW27878.1 GntR family transcriptional regulator [Arthrospira platensis YZ]KDR54371.1 GntR family transcriptional regulator [Arthrospira platensis str. Paraca]MBD2669376.1 GntR family transcriptional regulator [Arthrospira platensis FACHB-439]MBD2711018.1 GntR family transcriptional regulator [Arthrospira platensis FACHB-835]MDF2210794.1 GntR family transcriptional regulator [Arthrospira platensis NCB002]MDT9183190.1 GntR family 